MGYEPLTYEDYVYPLWANVMGWLIASSSIIMIPGVAIYKIIVTPGTFVQVNYFSIKISSVSNDNNYKYCIVLINTGSINYLHSVWGIKFKKREH